LINKNRIKVKIKTKTKRVIENAYVRKKLQPEDLTTWFVLW